MLPAAKTIDSLPDDVLAMIVGFLPAKSAIKTSVISQRWKKIWTLSPCLCFEARSPEMIVSITNSLHQFSDSKNSNMSTFHLLINMLSQRGNDINDLIAFALGRKPKNLSIRYVVGFDPMLDGFFDNDSVERLTLQVPGAPDLNHHRVSWPRLTHLSLCWNWRLSQESLNEVILGCPLLQTLTLCDCDRINLVDLSNSTAKVKKLDIIMTNGSEQQQLTVKAPHVTYLRLVVLGCTAPCVALDVDVSSLKEAKLEFYLTKTVLEHIMLKLEKTQKITFGARFLEMLSSASIPKQLMVEELTIEIGAKFVLHVIPGVERLLESSPALKKLTIDYDYNVESSDDEAVITLIKSVREHTTSLYKVVVRLGDHVPASKLENLKRKMTSDKTGSFSIEFIPTSVRSFETFFDHSTCSDH